jgi:hypothetical protein
MDYQSANFLPRAHAGDFWDFKKIPVTEFRRIRRETQISSSEKRDSWQTIINVWDLVDIGRETLPAQQAK